ncbi:MAG: hypothetical protein Q7S83_02765 [bacterium]|nr:hypothetical protein [bacterium]
MIIRIVFTKPLHRMDLGDVILSGLTPDDASLFPDKYLVAGLEGETALVLVEGFNMSEVEKALVFNKDKAFGTSVSKMMIDHVEDLKTETRLYP